MFAQVCLIVGALVAGDITLANGIRVVELPAEPSSFEIVAGYQVENSPIAAVLSTFFIATGSARRMAVAAYGAGGQIQLISDHNLTAVRVTGPGWARPAIENELANFFMETPEKNPELVVRALATMRAQPAPDFRATVEEELRAAVLGERANTRNASPADVDQFFTANYGTDRAFVLTSGSVSSLLEQVAIRTSRRPEPAAGPANRAERIRRYKPDLPSGAVIFASRVPSVYYEGWFAALFLDQLIKRSLPEATSALTPSLEDYYYRLEVPVPEGQFDDVVEERLIADLNRLQLTRASAEDLEAARAAAIEFLERNSTVRWFQSLGIELRRTEGIERLKAFSADDLRVAARDFVTDHAAVSWSPKPRQVSVDVESLDAPTLPVGAVNDRASLPELSAISIPAYPPHPHALTDEVPPERLVSGVSVVPSSKHVIFVAPQDFRIFDREPTLDDMKAYEVYRPQRILVMAPVEALPRVKERWAAFSGNTGDTIQNESIGDVANVDLSALVVLKMILDRRLIESGLWNDVRLEIKAVEGSRLAIKGDETARPGVLEWINEIGLEGPSIEEMAWAREAAIHHLDSMKPDLQSLIWQRDRSGVLSNPGTITATHVQDVARIYFQ